MTAGGLPKDQAAEERDLVRSDAATAVISSGSGFTAVEARLVQRLKQETLDAVKSLNMTDRSVGTESTSDTPVR